MSLTTCRYFLDTIMFYLKEERTLKNMFTKWDPCELSSYIKYNTRSHKVSQGPARAGWASHLCWSFGQTGNTNSCRETKYGNNGIPWNGDSHRETKVLGHKRFQGIHPSSGVELVKIFVYIFYFFKVFDSVVFRIFLKLCTITTNPRTFSSPKKRNLVSISSHSPFTPASGSWPPLSHHRSLEMCLFWIFHINGII